MRTLRRDLLLGGGLVIFLIAAVWSAVFVTSQAVDQLLRQDAEAEGEAWARYLAANVTDLGQIVAGAGPSAESKAFFEKAEQVGNVFLYKIYAPDGRLRLSSHAPDEVDPVAESIVAHNPAVAEAVLAGRTIVEVEDGDEQHGREDHEETEEIGGALPSFYSEAYVPVVVDGTVIGIMEAYVDQSTKHASFHARIENVALSLALIIAIAFGLPAVGFTWRTRQKRQADSRVEFLAQHDVLTEILNRSRFMRDLDEAIRLGCPVAVHVIDIDRFKDVNDSLGQASGDEILRGVARRLQKLSDKKDLLARLGSDEFAIAQIVRSPRHITMTARQIVTSLGETHRLGDRDVDVSASVGIAVAPVHGGDAASLLKCAEIALFHAKGEGPGSRSLFRPEMDTEMRERRALEGKVRDALLNGTFELHFQPLRRAANRRLAGFEALLRLPADDGGHISPALFIPVAERLGLIAAIGDGVIRRACAIAASWPTQLSVSVNLSPVQFAGGGLVATVQRALEDSGLSAGRLELEITEGLLLSDTESVLRQLAELRGLGVRIAMDDFGTGYSSLSYLWRFRFDKLKIDQSFVRALGGDDGHVASIVHAIVALGRSLGIRINAEGVETEEQAAFLARVGCDELQGFLLGRPMPVERLAAEILQDFRSAAPVASSTTQARSRKARES